jgi:hypothetical protein
MPKEIEILVKAKAKGCLVVEKKSHLLLEGEELLAAQRDGLYQQESHLLPPEGQIALSAPFPGCMHLGGAAAKNHQYGSVGQTEHFVIFFPREESESSDSLDLGDMRHQSRRRVNTRVTSS